MYKCKYFKIEELVPPQLLDLVEEDVAWKMFDENLLKAADWVKEKFSPNEPVIINDWSWSGPFKYSGLRTRDWEHYNPNSMHPYGKALDMKFPRNPKLVDEIREFIRDNQKTIPYITEVEEEVSWLHISTSDRYKHLALEGGVIFYKP